MPRRRANVLARWWCSLVESSTLWFVQVDREVGLCGVGVLAAQRWLGVGSGTLLGPEGSAVELLGGCCRVECVSAVVGVWGWLVFLVLPLLWFVWVAGRGV